MADVTYQVEALAIELLSRKSALDAYPKKHHELISRAEVESIVAKANKEGQQLEGVKAYEVSCTITFATATLTPEESDAVQEAIVSAFYSPILSPGLPDFGFYFVSLEPEFKESRQDTAHLRVRSLIFPFLAKLVA